MQDLPYKVAVLLGGPSSEREISLVSGAAVANALRARGFEVVEIDPASNTWLQELKNQEIRLVFLALHGAFGEDGNIQKILERESIVYTGSQATASQLAFDKSKAQGLFRENSIPVPAFQVIEEDSACEPRHLRLSWPLVVKPCDQGSSVGITLAKNREDFLKGFEIARNYSKKIMAEQYIHGRELTVGILGSQVLPIVEIKTEREFYDFSAKYKDAGTQYLVPAELDEKTSFEVKNLALRAYQALGCEIFGRVDIILSEDGQPYVLEINTLPGMTAKSLLPKAARAIGIEFDELCVRILRLSWARSERMVDQWQ